MKKLISILLWLLLAFYLPVVIGMLIVYAQRAVIENNIIDIVSHNIIPTAFSILGLYLLILCAALRWKWRYGVTGYLLMIFGLILFYLDSQESLLTAMFVVFPSALAIGWFINIALAFAMHSLRRNSHTESIANAN